MFVLNFCYGDEHERYFPETMERKNTFAAIPYFCRKSKPNSDLNATLGAWTCFRSGGEKSVCPKVISLAKGACHYSGLPNEFPWFPLFFFRAKGPTYTSLGHRPRKDGIKCGEG